MDRNQEELVHEPQLANKPFLNLYLYELLCLFIAIESAPESLPTNFESPYTMVKLLLPVLCTLGKVSPPPQWSWLLHRKLFHRYVTGERFCDCECDKTLISRYVGPWFYSKIKLALNCK